MNAGEIDAYLARIRHVGSRAPTSETLRALQRAHLATVPFENLDIHSARPIRLDRAAFFRKIVGERRGGFCYELNGLFGDLLTSLGFDVTLLSGRVASDAGLGPEFDHMVLLVTLPDEGRWIADVGFGRSFHEALSLDNPRDHAAEGWTYRVVSSGTEGQVESRLGDAAPRIEYVFSLIPHALEAFAAMCAFHQSPASHFARKIVCSKPRGEGRITISGRSLVVTDPGGRDETPLADRDAIVVALAQHFGITAPATLVIR